MLFNHPSLNLHLKYFDEIACTCGRAGTEKKNTVRTSMITEPFAPSPYLWPHLVPAEYVEFEQSKMFPSLRYPWASLVPNENLHFCELSLTLPKTPSPSYWQRLVPLPSGPRLLLFALVSFLKRI